MTASFIGLITRKLGQYKSYTQNVIPIMQHCTEAVGQCFKCVCIYNLSDDPFSA